MKAPTAAQIAEARKGAALFGRLGGASKSEKKAAAARRNGRKGGRAAASKGAP